MEYLLTILLLAIAAAFVLAPLRRRERADDDVEDPRAAELEARKQAKYREIRDAEQDHAQGKLSEEEFAVQNAELRREAIAILREIDEYHAGSNR